MPLKNLCGCLQNTQSNNNKKKKKNMNLDIEIKKEKKKNFPLYCVHCAIYNA